MEAHGTNSLRALAQVEALFSAGQVSEAITLCLSLFDRTRDPLMRANCAGVLIDMAATIGRADVVQKGISHLDELLAFYGPKCPAGVLYNLGNGWSTLGHRELGSLGRAGRWTSSSFQNAKVYYREALRACGSGLGKIKVEYVVNYANVLDSLGRHLEAIEAYDSALALDGTFGMALCNKAMAVQFFAEVSSTYRAALYTWAWQMLKEGLADPRVDRVGGPEARQEFERRIAAIEAKTTKPELLRTSLDHPPADLSRASEFERCYVDLCAKEHLFLNVHIHEHACDAATIDNVFISPPEPKPTDRFIELAKGLNQIIEDFSTARCLWVLAQCEDSDVLNVGARTLLPRVAGTGASLRHGLMKASFRLGFDVLDKLAGFVNDYLELGIPSHRVSFATAGRDCLWWVNAKDRTLRPKIEAVLGGSLGALYDIFLDFQANEVTGNAHYQGLRDMRNALTHRRLSVAVGQTDGVPEEIAPEALRVAARDMLFLARCAVMYLILFVNGRERKTAAQAQ